MQSDPYTIACFEYSADPNPLAFEIEGYINGFRYPKLAETDLNGNIEWYKVYESYGGQFRKIIQIEDGYVAIGQAIFSCQTDIALHYNQTMDGESEVYETLDNVTGDRYKLLYVIKTDDDGVIEKAGVYGIESAEDALNYETSGYDIFLDADGNYVFTGTASIKVGTVDVTTAYLGKLDANLDLIWHNSYLVDNEYLSYAECSIEYDGFYYLAASQATAPDPITSPAEAPESSRIHILKINRSTGNVVTDGDFVIDASIDADVDQFLDYPYYPVSGFPEFESFNDCTVNAMVVNNGDLLIAAIINRSRWYRDTGVRGLGRVYRIGFDCFSATPCSPDVIPVKEVQTFDLRMGITNTFEGGYAIVSSFHVADPFTPATAIATEEVFYYPSVSADIPYDDSGFEGTTRYWNSDTYVAKFNSSDVMSWEATYPKTTNAGNYFPNDIKMEECLYHIVEAPDHGLVVAGNSSSNFDDDLVIKIYNECAINTTYSTGSGDIINNSDINFNTTWNSSKKIKGIITVKTGKSLTITGATTVIQFTDSKAANFPTSIIVERGGKLLVTNGATLTGNTACGTMWDGIVVYGTNGQNQPNPATLVANNYFDVSNNHGVVLVNDGATIKNARKGILVGKGFSKTLVSSYGGGIVITEDAIFENNAHDIYFNPFNKTNRSLLRNTQFVTSNILLDDFETPLSHVYIQQVKNVNIRGCNFENTTSSTDYTNEKRGKGVYAFNSYFIVDDNPMPFTGSATGSDPNTFSDLTYGVYAVASEVGANNIIINKNNFDNNFRGVYLSGSVLSETNQNTFTIKAENAAYGLYLDGCTAYDVDENLFTKDVGDLFTTTGLIINNSGTGDNLVYRNTFSNLKHGSIAMKINGAAGSTNHGLVFKCGDYSTSWADIAVVSQDAVVGSVNPDQGECLSTVVAGYLTAPANNLFTAPTDLVTKWQFYTSSDVDDILYVFFEDDDEDAAPFARPKEFTDPVDPYPFGPVSDNGCLSEVFDEDSWASIYCPTNFLSGGSGRLSNPNNDNLLIDASLTGNFKISDTIIEVTKLETDWYDNIQLQNRLRYFLKNEFTDSILALSNSTNTPLFAYLYAAITSQNPETPFAADYSDIYETDLATQQGYNYTLQTIISPMQNDTSSIALLSTEALNTINELANLDNRIGIQAKHLNCIINNKPYQEIIPIIYPEMEEIAKTMQSIATDNSMHIYPNPMSNYGIIQVNIENANASGQLTITDILGVVYKTYNLVSGINQIELSNASLPVGIYIAKVTNEDANNISKQFIVIH